MSQKHRRNELNDSACKSFPAAGKPWEASTGAHPHRRVGRLGLGGLQPARQQDSCGAEGMSHLAPGSAGGWHSRSVPQGPGLESSRPGSSFRFTQERPLHSPGKPGPGRPASGSICWDTSSHLGPGHYSCIRPAGAFATLKKRRGGRAFRKEPPTGRGMAPARSIWDPFCLPHYHHFGWFCSPAYERRNLPSGRRSPLWHTQQLRRGSTSFFCLPLPLLLCWVLGHSLSLLRINQDYT